MTGSSLSPDEREALVPAEGDGQRLDRFLAECFPNYSRKQISRVIQAGRVHVNGRRAKGGLTLQRGDRLRLPVLHKAVEEIETTRARQRIADTKQDDLHELYRDEDLLVVWKPAGLPVHGGAGILQATLIDRLREDILAGFGLVHRLDKDTTGAIALVRGDDARRITSDRFADPEGPVEKIYEAIVSGAPREEEGEIDLPLAPPGHGSRAFVDKIRGKPAVTRWRVLERLTRSARVELRLLTGRTHQIRVHLEALGHPLLVDPVYGHRRGWKIPDPRGDRAVRLTRTPLHARELTMPHPTRDELVTVRAPLALDMKRVLELLRVVTARGLQRGGLPPPS